MNILSEFFCYREITGEGRVVHFEYSLTEVLQLLLHVNYSIITYNPNNHLDTTSLSTCKTIGNYSRKYLSGTPEGKNVSHCLL